MIFLFFSQFKMSEDNSENLYYYSNKGKQYTFNLDDLTTEELKKFEKMTERQRLKFITNFELEKETPFQDSISLKPTMVEARNEKYGDYALLKAKIDEAERIMKKDANEGWDNVEKITLLDDDGNIKSEYLDEMNYITEDDLKNCMKAFDLDDISLGMLKKYYNRKIESLNMTGIKSSFLEALKKFYSQLYEKDETLESNDKKEKKDSKIVQKLDEIIKLLTPSTATPLKDIDYDTTKEKMEDVMVDVNKDLKNEMMSLIPKNDKKLQNLVNNYDWDKVIDIANQLKLNEIIPMLNNYKILEDIMKNIINYSQNSPTEPLTIPYTSKPTIKVEEVDDEDLPEPITEEMKELPLKDEPKIEEMKEESSKPSTPQVPTPQGPASRSQIARMKKLQGAANNFSYNKRKLDDYLKNGIPSNFKKVFPETSFSTNYIYEDKNTDMKIIIEKYYDGDIAESIYQNSILRFTIRFDVSEDKYTYLEYENEKLKYKVVFKNGDKTVNVKPGIRGKSEDIIFTEYGKGYKIKYTSGSIVDKIKDKLFKSVNSEIKGLKDEDKNIYKKLESLENSINDLNRKLSDVDTLKESLKKKSDISLPAVKPSNFLDEIKQPHKPLKPVKPTPKPKVQDEYSDIKKILDDRRKDIEYSEDEDSVEEWGEGVKPKSKNERRIEILEFLKSLED